MSYRRIDGLECNELPEGCVVYDQAREQVHYLNRTATAVLDLCDGNRDADAIADLLQSVFSLPAPPRSDVADCLAALASQGLIERRP